MTEIKYAVSETPDTLCYQASQAETDEDARVFLLKAAAMDPHHVQTNYNLALLYKKWGNTEQAMGHFNEVRLYQDSLYFLGKLYQSEGDNGMALCLWEDGSKNGCPKCQGELLEYHFKKVKINDPDSIEGFGKCKTNLCVPGVISQARMNYMMGIYYLVKKDIEGALRCFKMTECSDAKFMIWKNSMDNPVKNNQYRYEAAMAGHPEAMFEQGKWLIETGGDFTTAVQLIIDSRFPGYKDTLYDIYTKRLQERIAYLALIKDVLPPESIKALYRIGEKTNLKRLHPNPEFLEDCAEQGLTRSKIRIVINEINSGGCDTEKMKDLFQELIYYAHNHNVDAAVQVAKCYNSGKGVKMCQPQAEEWYRFAAEKGSREAQNMLAWWLRSGVEATRKDLEESKLWTNKCLELREGEKEVPEKEKYHKYLEHVDRLIKEIDEKEKEHKAALLFKGPRRVGRDQFLFQAAKLYDRAVDGGPEMCNPDPEAAMLVGMVFGMTGMKDKNQEWFDKALQTRESPVEEKIEKVITSESPEQEIGKIITPKGEEKVIKVKKVACKDSWVCTRQPMGGKIPGEGERVAVWEEFPKPPTSKMTKKVEQVNKTLSVDTKFKKAEKLEVSDKSDETDDEEEEFIDIASDLDKL